MSDAPEEAIVESSARETGPAATVHAAPTARTSWYTDPSKLVGVLGFVLALGTLGERMWVRDQEQTLQRLQQLREVTSALADIQVEYLQALAEAPSNIYALGVAKNTKRQMYLQTAAALLKYDKVKRETSSQVLAALGGEVMNDGRYEAAMAYLTDALQAPGAEEATRPYLLRSLGHLYRIPNTRFVNVATSRDYFDQALEIFDKRPDDTGHLAWAETVLTEASVEVTYGDRERAKNLASRAAERLAKVRSVSPLKAQLERLAAGFARGEQFAQTQTASVQQPLPTHENPPSDAPSPVAADSTVTAVIEIWTPIPGQVSGVEMGVTVDGKDVGDLSNLREERQLKVPPLSSGVHKFAFTNIKVYFIDPAKGPSMTVSGLSCEGLWELLPQRTRLKANVGSGPNGVMCSLK